jgi:hypothetical protein
MGPPFDLKKGKVALFSPPLFIPTPLRSGFQRAERRQRRKLPGQPGRLARKFVELHAMAANQLKGSGETDEGV